jgi:hypothetical protein
MSEKQWPKAGSKVTFKGTTEWFFFSNILKDGNDLLEIGKEYTITKIELASSWCAVILDEFPDKKFSLNWFTYDKDLTTDEVRKIERDGWELATDEEFGLSHIEGLQEQLRMRDATPKEVEHFSKKMKEAYREE